MGEILRKSFFFPLKLVLTAEAHSLPGSYMLMRFSLRSNQHDFSSTAMTRSGLSLEELRIVEGQGQSSEVITPSEELNRINDMGTYGHQTRASVNP